MTEQESEKSKTNKTHKPKKGETEELHQQIEILQKEKDEIFGKLQRVSADYLNFQKRVPRQIADTVSYERDKIIRTLLPVLDNFEHILKNVPLAENIETIVKGVRITYEQMLETMKSHSVEQIKAVGEKFEPELHEAITHQIRPELPDNTVLEELQKGYKLNGRVIRPSRVLVNKLPSQQTPQQPDEQQQQKPHADPHPPAAEECDRPQGQ